MGFTSLRSVSDEVTSLSELVSLRNNYCCQTDDTEYELFGWNWMNLKWNSTPGFEGVWQLWHYLYTVLIPCNLA